MEDHTNMVRCSDGIWRSLGNMPIHEERPRSPVIRDKRLTDAEFAKVKAGTWSTDDERALQKRLAWKAVPLHKKVWCFIQPLSIFTYYWVEWMVGIGVVSLITFLCFGFYAEATSPSFLLHKNEWVCTMEHTQVNTTFMMSGKTMMPLTTSTAVCDRYERRL